ncbi:hypothetical protein POKO110462_03830 [Pontibacter korlensis]|uniref:Uncharacterized protein n=1 Tax=Pontibacter korlensis TaxID=400092 RepID=A0A0E3ZEP0_9BACT|nr:hypothetical protein [Pontibacter korlensis]AKD03788.1 hypothetical protein PKOR_12485 [Pontibacter korlensis]
MKTASLSYKPQLKNFLAYFALMLSLFTVMVAGFYLIVNKGESLPEYFSSVAVLYILLPLFNAAAFAYSSRKHELIISEVNDPAYVAKWAVELLQLNGMRIKSTEDNMTVLESGKKYTRMLNNWFGTELLTLRTSENEVRAIGNFRCIDILDTKIKFGQVAFKDQPYKHS